MDIANMNIKSRLKNFFRISCPSYVSHLRPHSGFRPLCSRFFRIAYNSQISELTGQIAEIMASVSLLEDEIADTQVQI